MKIDKTMAPYTHTDGTVEFWFKKGGEQFSARIAPDEIDDGEELEDIMQLKLMQIENPKVLDVSIEDVRDALISLPELHKRVLKNKRAGVLTLIKERKDTSRERD